MSINLFYKLYFHYKDLHDFNVSHMTYKELEKKQIENEEWLPF